MSKPKKRHKSEAFLIQFRSIDELKSLILQTHARVNDALAKVDADVRDARLTCYLCKGHSSGEYFCFGCERVLCPKCDVLDFIECVTLGKGHDPRAHLGKKKRKR